MNKYRSHNCSDKKKDVNSLVTLSEWLHRKRDHGNLLFIDLRDHYGLTQCGSKITIIFFNFRKKQT